MAACQYVGAGCICAIQGSRQQQLEMAIIECVESEKHGLIVGLFICVIVVRKTQAADTITPIPRRRAKERTSYVLINFSMYDMTPSGRMAPSPSPRLLYVADLNICKFAVVIGHAAHYELPLAIPVGGARRQMSVRGEKS